VTPEELLSNGTRIRIGSCWVVTTLPNGAIVNACPTEDSIQPALELGYCEDVAALTRDHDPLHSRLCDWLGMPHSFSLMRSAGYPTDPMLAELEEAAVLATQKFKRAWEIQSCGQ
jgi:hypothetical protein